MAKISVADLLGSCPNIINDVPNGVYRVKIINARTKPSHYSEGGTFFQAFLEIVEGEYIRYSLNFATTLTNEEGFFGSKFINLVQATFIGVDPTTTFDLADLIGKECLAIVKHYTDNDYRNHTLPYYIASFEPLYQLVKSEE